MTTEGMQQAVAAMRGGRGWMKFLGIISIIYGALWCMSIIGAVVGWIPLWLGIVLLQASSKAEKLERDGDESTLAEYMQLVSKCFRIAGITELVLLILTVVIAVVAGLLVTVFAGLKPSATYAPGATVAHEIIEDEITEETKETGGNAMVTSSPEDVGNNVIWMVKLEKLNFSVPMPDGTPQTLVMDLALICNQPEKKPIVAISQEEYDEIRNTVIKQIPVLKMKLGKAIAKLPITELTQKTGQTKIREIFKKQANELIRESLKDNPSITHELQEYGVEVQIINWEFK